MKFFLHFKLIIVFLSVSSFFPSITIAQSIDKTDLKIGFVNIRKLMAEAPQIAEAQKVLSKEFEKESLEITVIRNELEQLNRDFDNTEIDNELFLLQKKIDTKQRELARLQSALQDEYSLKRNEELGNLQSLIVKIVALVSREKKLDIVLNNTGVIYVNNRIDITADVMQKLSEQ